MRGFFAALRMTSSGAGCKSGKQILPGMTNKGGDRRKGNGRAEALPLFVL
jgi:hypothetical protein